ncbi:Dot/Icm T4SS effector kinase LegK1 [Legionella fallonii]|uniref:Serine/threonine-protein kinase n=1 Tax=Legionella fallonii LLAP-10 TaxID=1212491 RepID=A0A098G4F3_9GAMM|nr:Dot/Icm T4SS effector kinase LegK1 [Legionella fallonii]CEG56851.1 Serine/threonine-protein kinase [Legionella fallonii LLAP-10]
MPTIVKLVINPLKIHKFNPEHYNALYSFLSEGGAEGIWSGYKDYEYTYGSIQYQFSFTQSLLKRKRKQGQEGARFEVYDTNQSPIGKGGYGVVYPITGTIKFTSGAAQVKPGGCKVVKIQDHSQKNKVIEVKQEYKGLLLSGHLHPKPPIFIAGSNGAKSYLIMDQAEGVSLEKILHPKKRGEIFEHISQFTVAKRIELTLALLNAIKKQVEEKKLVHRDIKPSNLIVDLNQSPPKVTVIDFGFNLKQGLQDYRKVGTRAYRPPESFVLFPRYSIKSDVYSVGRVLSYLWGDYYLNYYIPKDKDLDYIKNKSTNNDLFNTPTIKFVLTMDDQNKIRNHLNQMISIDSNLRPTLDESIRLFSQMNFQYYEKLDQLNRSFFDQERLKQPLDRIRKQLIKLKEKEIDLRTRGYSNAADRMHHLVRELQINAELIANENDLVLLKGYKNACLAEIDAAKPVLQSHRGIWWLIAEIVTAISLLGVGYLIAVGINYACTNKIGLFSQTKSEQLVDEVKESLLNLVPSPI